MDQVFVLWLCWLKRFLSALREARKYSMEGYMKVRLFIFTVFFFFP